ncbi:DNA-methyltransferase [Candidatus Mycalebacterium sp.]
MKGLDSLSSESIHFVATDPPYFLDGMGDDWNKEKLKKRVKPGIIGGLPAGMKFDRKQAKRLKSFMLKVSGKIYRVLKPGGFVAVFSQARLSYAMGSALDEAGFEIRDMLAWKYEGQAKAFSQEHFVRKMKISNKRKQEILKEIAGKKTPQLKPQFEPIILAQKPRKGTFVENWISYQTGLMCPDQSFMGNGFPGTILEAPKPKKGTEVGHMTVKPVPVMRQLIRLFTIEGQTVLDPFVGSGTTAVAALQDNRRFMGFEIDSDYTQIALKRVKSEQGLF